MKSHFITTLTPSTAMIALNTDRWCNSYNESIILSRKTPGSKEMVGFKLPLEALLTMTKQMFIFGRQYGFDHVEKPYNVKYCTGDFYMRVEPGERLRLFVRQGTGTEIMLITVPEGDVEMFTKNLQDLVMVLEHLYWVKRNQEDTGNPEDMNDVPEITLEHNLEQATSWHVVKTFNHFDERYVQEIVAITKGGKPGILKRLEISTKAKTETMYFLESEVNASVDFIIDQIDNIEEDSIIQTELITNQFLCVTRGGGQAVQNPLNIISVARSQAWVLNWLDGEEHIELLKSALIDIKV